MSVRVEVLYFAALRDAAGIASEHLETDAADLSALYAGVLARHRLPFPQQQLPVAVVAFLPSPLDEEDFTHAINL